MATYNTDNRRPPDGIHSVNSSGSPESREHLIIDGREVIRDQTGQSIGQTSGDDDICQLYREAKIEMLEITESGLKLKLELRDIKQQFRNLLLTYLDSDQLHRDSIDEFQRCKTPEFECEELLEYLPMLEDSGLQDSSTIIYSTDACYHDSSTVEETPTNHRMPPDRYLMLKEGRSRASSDSMISPCHLSQNLMKKENVSECQSVSRRASMRLAYPISFEDLCKETDEESGCYSRGPTYPGSDSTSQDAQKSSTDLSNDYSMEASKDSDVNFNDLVTMSSDGIKSSFMTDSSIPGMSSTHDNDESSYKESDAACSPDRFNTQHPDMKQRKPMKEGEEVMTDPMRKSRRRRSLMNRINHQTSAATWSSTNSDSRLPNAPRNSPNSTSPMTDFDASTCFIPNARKRTTVSTTTIDQLMFDDHLLNTPLKDKPASTTSSVFVIPQKETISSWVTTPSNVHKDANIPWQTSKQRSLKIMASSHRPPCIGGEAINESTSADESNDLAATCPAGTPQDISYNESPKELNVNTDLGPNSSTSESSSQAEGASCLTEPDVINIDPVIEKSAKRNRLSKTFPLFKTLQNIKKHFKK